MGRGRKNGMSSARLNDRPRPEHERSDAGILPYAMPPSVRASRVKTPSCRSPRFTQGVGRVDTGPVLLCYSPALVALSSSPTRQHCMTQWRLVQRWRVDSTDALVSIYVVGGGLRMVLSFLWQYAKLLMACISLAC